MRDKFQKDVYNEAVRNVSKFIREECAKYDLEPDSNEFRSRPGALTQIITTSKITQEMPGEKFQTKETTEFLSIDPYSDLHITPDSKEKLVRQLRKNIRRRLRNRSLKDFEPPFPKFAYNMHQFTKDVLSYKKITFEDIKNNKNFIRIVDGYISSTLLEFGKCEYSEVIKPQLSIFSRIPETFYHSMIGQKINDVIEHPSITSPIIIEDAYYHNSQQCIIIHLEEKYTDLESCPDSFDNTWAHISLKE